MHVNSLSYVVPHAPSSSLLHAGLYAVAVRVDVERGVSVEKWGYFARASGGGAALREGEQTVLSGRAGVEGNVSGQGCHDSGSER